MRFISSLFPTYTPYYEVPLVFLTTEKAPTYLGKPIKVNGLYVNTKVVRDSHTSKDRMGNAATDKNNSSDNYVGSYDTAGNTGKQANYHCILHKALVDKDF